jgi:hypothetical protein
MLTLKILPDQSLRLTADNATRAQIKELRERDQGDVTILSDLTESYWTNGGFCPFDAGDGRPFVGLTSAPCIAEDMDYGDDGKPAIRGRLWWFPDYMIRSCVEELLTRGRTTFHFAGAWDQENPPEDWEDCGQCGGAHPPKYTGDCRNDLYRWPSDSARARPTTESQP